MRYPTWNGFTGVREERAIDFVSDLRKMEGKNCVLTYWGKNVFPAFFFAPSPIEYLYTCDMIFK